MTLLEGRLVCGLGQAAEFTQIAWVRQQLIGLAGIDPYPGTVNLALGDEDNRQRWRNWRNTPGLAMAAADDAYCSARCYPVRVNGRIPAAVVLPDLAAYPQDKVEVVSALPLRRHLSLAEGSPLSLELCGPLKAKTVLFDIDGTLVDSVGAYLEIARIAARQYGFEVTEAHVRHSLATGGNFWKAVVPDDCTDGEAIIAAMSAHAARQWPETLREHGRVFAGLAETLDALTRQGIALGIVSGARPEVLELLREDGILERFDCVVLGADVSRRKPDPEGLLKGLRELRSSADEAIYVGDTPVDVAASRAAGVRVVAVLTGAGDSAMMSAQEPDRLVHTHARLAEVIAPW